MYNLLSSVLPHLLKPTSQPNLDNWVFRLHYRLTVAALAGAAVLVGRPASQHFIQISWFPWFFLKNIPIFIPVSKIFIALLFADLVDIDSFQFSQPFHKDDITILLR